MTHRDFFWDDPFFSNVWDDFEKMRTDIWKGHEDFFSRFNQQEKALQNDAESFMKKESRMEKSMKKETSSSSSKTSGISTSGISTSGIPTSGKDFASAISDSSDFGRSRSWLMP